MRLAGMQTGIKERLEKMACLLLNWLRSPHFLGGQAKLLGSMSRRLGGPSPDQERATGRHGAAACGREDSGGPETWLKPELCPLIMGHPSHSYGLPTPPFPGLGGVWGRAR